MLQNKWNSIKLIKNMNEVNLIFVPLRAVLKRTINVLIKTSIKDMLLLGVPTTLENHYSHPPRHTGDQVIQVSLSCVMVCHYSLNASNYWINASQSSYYILLPRMSRTCSIGFKSGERAGQGRTRAPASSRNWLVNDDLCAGALSCWKRKWG